MHWHWQCAGNAAATVAATMSTVCLHLWSACNCYNFGTIVKDIKNAFFVVTKAKYQGEVFEVEPYYGDEIHLHLATKDLELGKKLNFYELHDGEGNSYYLGEVKITEVEKIWEERQKSSLDIPLPESFELYKEIKLESNYLSPSYLLLT